MLTARQAIYDDQLTVVAYELLLRAEQGEAEAIGADPTRNAALFGSRLRDLIGDHPVHLEVSADFLASSHPLPLHPQRVVLGLAAGTLAGPEVADAARRRKKEGYRLAIDLDAAEDRATVVALADVVRLDVGTLGEFATDALVRTLAPLGARLMARGVESHDSFEALRALEIDLFQGYFFATPELVPGQGMPVSSMSTLRLLAAMNAPGVDLRQLERLISLDVGLSYSLLRSINSPYFGLRREITSIRQCLVLVGLDNIRRWATLLALAEVEDKPHELMVTALLRARLAELLAPTFGESDPDALFIVGLFSVLDALMDAPMAEVLEALPLAEAVAAALLRREGTKGQALSCVIACERGDVIEARNGPAADALLGDLYLEAAAWATQAGEGLRPSVPA